MRKIETIIRIILTIALFLSLLIPLEVKKEYLPVIGYSFFITFTCFIEGPCSLGNSSLAYFILGIIFVLLFWTAPIVGFLNILVISKQSRWIVWLTRGILLVALAAWLLIPGISVLYSEYFGIRVYFLTIVLGVIVESMIFVTEKFAAPKAQF